MKKIFFTALSVILYTVSFCQFIDSVPFDLYQPQSKRFWNKTGKYQMIITVSKSSFSAGDSILVRIYFTGYGLNEASKLMMKCSDEAFTTDSYIVSSLVEEPIIGDPKHRTELGWGATKNSLPKPNGFIMGLLGLEQHDTTYGEYGFYYDQTSQMDDYSLLTEGMNGQNQAPVELFLISKKDISSGDYFIDFRYTYFDGERWQIDSKILNFHITSLLEEHDIAAWIIGTIIALISILPLIRNGVIVFLNFIKKLRKIRKSRIIRIERIQLQNPDKLQ